MANTFKSDTKLNVVTDAVTILLTNTSGSSVQVDVALIKNGSADNTHLIKNAPVPAGSALEIISGSKIIMQSSDVLRIRAGVASKIDATVSYLDQT
jgi:hypothetical protein